MHIATTAILVLVAVHLTLAIDEEISTHAPNIIPRAEWGARAPKKPIPKLKQLVPYVIIHHSPAPACNTRDVCQKRVKSFQDYHMNEKGWGDIGYNFVVGEDGNIYEGLGWGKQGSHAKRFNSKSIGITIIGDYNNRTPNAAAINAVTSLIAHAVATNQVKPNYKLLGHRQTKNTDCPGNKLYELMKTWPRWSPSA